MIELTAKQNSDAVDLVMRRLKAEAEEAEARADAAKFKAETERIVLDAHKTHFDFDLPQWRKA